MFAFCRDRVGQINSIIRVMCHTMRSLLLFTFLFHLAFRAVWKRIDRGSDLTDSPTSTGMGYWSGVGHNKHPSRQLTEDDKRRIAETR